MILLACGRLETWAQASREYQLKAVFLHHFAQFTEWPTNAFARTESPIVIGVLGTDPFGTVLDDTIRGEKVQGRRLMVERYQRAEQIQTCHILFISQSEDSRLERDLDSLRGRPVLTVSDIENSAFRGVMVRMMNEQNKIRLRVNMDALNTSGLVLSSKLLRAAEVIPEKPKNP